MRACVWAWWNAKVPLARTPGASLSFPREHQMKETHIPIPLYGSPAQPLACHCDTQVCGIPLLFPSSRENTCKTAERGHLLQPHSCFWGGCSCSCLLGSAFIHLFLLCCFAPCGYCPLSWFWRVASTSSQFSCQSGSRLCIHMEKEFIRKPGEFSIMEELVKHARRIRDSEKYCFWQCLK